MWARAMRRAELPLAYSAGFSPRPRISFAQALPTGTTTEADLMDIVLERPLPPEAVMARLNAQLPPNARVLKAEEVAYNAPSVESQLAAATYALGVEGAANEDALRRTVADLLASPSIPRVREREGRRREFDLRAFIAELEVLDWAGAGGRLRLTLATGESLSARPEEVVEALGLRLVSGSVHRTALTLKSAGPEPERPPHGDATSLRAPQ
jgi:radical SAM-linked protein